MICAAPDCESVFEPTRPWSKYCAPRCRTRTAAARWRADNPEKSRAATRRVMRVARAASPEKYRAVDRARAGTPARRLQGHASRVRRRAGGGYHTHRDETAIIYASELLMDPCAYCGAPTEEIDHIKPIALGGGPAWDNLTASCTACNRRKHAKPMLTFLLDRVAA